MISASMTLYLTFFFAPMAYENFYSDNVLKVLFSSPIEPLFVATEPVSWTLFLFHLFAYFSMYFRTEKAKYYFSTAVLANLFVVSCGGISSYTGLDMLLLALLNMLDGVILYTLFLGKIDAHQVQKGVADSI